MRFFSRKRWILVLLALQWSMLNGQWSMCHAQFKTDRLVMIGRSALYFEDYVLSIQYFNQAISAKPYLYEPWFYRGVAKYYLDEQGLAADIAKANANLQSQTNEINAGLQKQWLAKVMSRLFRQRRVFLSQSIKEAARKRFELCFSAQGSMHRPYCLSMKLMLSEESAVKAIQGMGKKWR